MIKEILKVHFIPLCSGALLISITPPSFAKDRTNAFKIGNLITTFDEVYEGNQSDFFKLEKQKYDLIENLAKEKFLLSFWDDLAIKNQTSPDKAREEYFKKNTTIKDAEVKKFLDRYKNHPRLKELSENEKWKQGMNYLTAKKMDDLTEKIIDDGLRQKKLVLLYPKPEEPVYQIKITDKDPIRYGPSPSDTVPIGCSYDCPITVIEYSEFQCPFCVRVAPTIKQLLSDYKGKIRWIVRDFPLNFHNRAKQAAVAAKCAGEQRKYWHMYETILNNQKAIEDSDLLEYGKQIGLSMEKYKLCLSQPQIHLESIDANYKSGEKLGVSGTPAFFINGRKIDGAVPYEGFKNIFDEELIKIK